MMVRMGIIRTTVGVENPLQAGDIRELSEVIADCMNSPLVPGQQQPRSPG